MNPERAELIKEYVELSRAIKTLDSYCLFKSAKWCSELLLSIELTSDERKLLARIEEKTKPFDTTEETDKVLFARHLFLNRDYQRVSSVLEHAEGQNAVFLSQYASYLCGAHRVHSQSRPRQCGGWAGDHLWGKVLSKDGRKEEAIKYLKKSLDAFPLNWSAWEDLISLDNSHWIHQIVLFYAASRHHLPALAVERGQKVVEKYPKHIVLKRLIAVALAELNEYDISHRLFTETISADPNCLDHLDTFSNVLYITGQKSELWSLAHRHAVSASRHPEACCVLGNALAAAGDHTRAAHALAKAARMGDKAASITPARMGCSRSADKSKNNPKTQTSTASSTTTPTPPSTRVPSPTTAYVLLGHELLACGRGGAAVGAYRRGAALDVRECRAWYGLSVAQRIGGDAQLALESARRACAAAPRDGRMWKELAACCEECETTHTAIEAYRKAVECNRCDTFSLSRLGHLYAQIGDLDSAAIFFKMEYDCTEEEDESQDTIDALLFLATYYKRKGEKEEALKYSSRLALFSGKEAEKAREYLTELNDVIESEQQQQQQRQQ